MAETVIIIGGGIAGMAAALALNAKGFVATIVDRDEILPTDITPHDSWNWKLAGAPQARQPHFFMGRLRNLLHQNYPELIAEFFEAGIWEMHFADTIHPAAKPNYTPEPGDKDITPLCARRTTFQMVLRRYIERHKIATFRSGARVDELIFAMQPDGVNKVIGCHIATGTAKEDIFGDIVVDTSGRGSSLVAKLRGSGVAVSEEHFKSEMVYNTRHYRLHEGQTFPPVLGYAGAEFADFFVGAGPADNGTFTVTLGCWKDDPLLGKLAGNLPLFEQICARVPKVVPWIDPARSEPVSNVIAFANMDFLWRSLVEDGEPQVLNYFLAGDALIRSNPKFGRGCTWGSVTVHHLADVLATEPDPRARLLKFEQVVRDDFRSDWEDMLGVDQHSRVKYEAEVGLRPKTLKLKLATMVERHVLNVAMLADARVLRAVQRGYHGLDGVMHWTRNWKIWLAIAQAALPSKKLRALKKLNVGRPSRAEIAAWAGNGRLV